MMTLPRFFISPDILQRDAGLSVPSDGAPDPIFGPDQLGREIGLDEDASRHIIQVLRMKQGEELQLTDGRGNLLKAAITDDHKKRCRVRILGASYQPASGRRTAIAISLLKNASRFEWFLEKATELGVGEIYPLISERTEKQHFRMDRMQHILVSAMLQSQQVRLPLLHPPTPCHMVIENRGYGRKFIAHCLEDAQARIPLTEALLTNQFATPGSSDLRDHHDSLLILIGPEGDFSPAEIDAAFRQGYQPVTLGDTRLRTETAGVVAATLLQLVRPG